LSSKRKPGFCIPEELNATLFTILQTLQFPGLQSAKSGYSETSTPTPLLLQWACGGLEPLRGVKWINFRDLKEQVSGCLGDNQSESFLSGPSALTSKRLILLSFLQCNNHKRIPRLIVPMYQNQGHPRNEKDPICEPLSCVNSRLYRHPSTCWTRASDSVTGQCNLSNDLPFDSAFAFQYHLLPRSAVSTCGTIWGIETVYLSLQIPDAQYCASEVVDTPISSISFLFIPSSLRDRISLEKFLGTRPFTRLFECAESSNVGLRS
jgi:hypothetical protein